MNEEENLIINDINSANLDAPKNEKEEIPWKKIIIISSITICIILAIIIVILISIKNSSNEDSSTTPDSPDNPDNPDKPFIGIISCIYNIDSDKSEVKILGDEYKKTSDFDIYINGNKTKYSKTYKFSSFGIMNIDFKLYSNIEMAYMFKGVSSLISVDMKSINNVEITSIISAFEDCKNLESFSISGFITNKIKSLQN